jgi:hypothetical protein
MKGAIGMDGEKITWLVAEHKERITELYDLYAEEFPEKAVFWIKAAGDEKRHAEIIRELGKMLRTKELIFVKDGFSEKDISDLAETIDNEYKKANSGPISYKQALAAAAAIQKSTIELEFFDFFKPNSERLKEMLLKLQREIHAHLQLILSEIQTSERY